MAKKTDAPGTHDYSSGVKKVLVLGKDGTHMAGPGNPLPVDASVSVDSMTMNAEMKVDSGHDLYEANNVTRSTNWKVTFDNVPGLTLAKVQSVENKTKGVVYSTKGATVNSTSITLVANNQPEGTSVIVAGDEIEVIYRGKSRLTSGELTANVYGKYNETDLDLDDGDKAPLQLNEKGELKVTGGAGASSVTAKYISPTDFVAVYENNTTIQLNQLPVNIIDSSQIVYIKQIKDDNTSNIFVNGANGITITHVDGNIYVHIDGIVLDIFEVGDVYEVGINGQDKAYDLGLDVVKTINQAPDSNKYVSETFIDEVNLAAGTTYFPSDEGFSMDGFKHLGLTGFLTDGNGSLKLEVEVTNEQDLDTATWMPISGYSPNDGTIESNFEANNNTKNVVWFFENLCFSNVRFKITPTGATNTVLVAGKRMY